MKPQPTKQDERKLMQELQRQREERTPQHRDPEWAHALWRRLMT